VAGGVEAALTAGVIAYLQRNNLPVLRINRGARPPAEAASQVDVTGEPVGEEPGLEPAGQPAYVRSPWKWAVAGILTLALLTPLGLLASGGAFGEDAPSDLDLGHYGLDAIPSGLNHYNGFWSHSLLGGYGFSSGENATLGYLLSAAVGIAVITLLVGVVWLAARFVSRTRGDRAPAPRQPVTVGGGS